MLKRLSTMVNSINYREILDGYANKHINRRVSNSKLSHAAIALEKMFSTALFDIRIFAKNLSPDLFGEKSQLLTATESFLLRPESTLKILVQEDINGKDFLMQPLGMLLQSLENRTHGQVDIRQAIGKYREEAKKYFVVMDEEGYRYESEAQEGVDGFAIVNFHEPKTAQNLAKSFDTAFEIAGINSNIYNLEALFATHSELVSEAIS